MANDEKREDMREFVGSDHPVLNHAPDLNEALYTMSELGLWPDSVDSVSEAQAVLCWRLIERLTSDRLPDNLKM